MRVVFGSWLFVCLIYSPAIAGGPPKELMGKSVSISWNETREQKWPGETQLRHVNRNGDLIIYVSSAGRVSDISACETDLTA